MTAEQLEALSKAATQGTISVLPNANSHCFDGRLMLGDKCIAFVEGDQTQDEDGEYQIVLDPEALLLFELWNAYRTGQLVMVDDAAVERVGVGIAKALYGPDFDPFSNAEMQDFCEQLATAAIAAMGGK